MSTKAWLQNHLRGEIHTAPNSWYKYKDVTDIVTCANGVTLSVQASRNHYCTPRDDVGPYTEVEVWCILPSATPVVEFDFDEGDPSAYVPIEAVAAFIDRQGGPV